jgi:hypothetical protein
MAQLRRNLRGLLIHLEAIWLNNMQQHPRW